VIKWLLFRGHPVPGRIHVTPSITARETSCGTYVQETAASFGRELTLLNLDRSGRITNASHLGGKMEGISKKRSGWSWWYLLLLIQFIAVLWPPFYNRVEPEWIGMPFFYWYQLLWVIIGAVLTAIVYFATEE